MKTLEEITTWLIASVAKKSEVEITEVDPTEDIRDLGLSSMQLVELTNELEDWTGQYVDPSIIFEHSTIKALAEALIRDSEEWD
jgi:acyl carrier protein